MPNEALSGPISIYTTLPDEGHARRIARTLVTESLAACANAFPIESVYRWKGEIVEEREWGLLLKTRAELYPQIEERLRALHPYEIPAIVAYPIARGLPAYMQWIDDATHAAES
jgi:periplasmic divalent cation tolerance protein